MAKEIKMSERNDTFGSMETMAPTEWNASRKDAGVTLGDMKTMGWNEAGIVLAGRYRVVKRLGEGGMGSVWLAEDTKLDGRKVAVKMLPSVLAGKKGAYRQVKAEALMAMKLSHPNIATVRAFEEDEGGNPFLVMDYIEGEGLDDILAEKGALGEEETRRILGPVAAALDYAHLQGVVHRDVKPGNVMVRKDGTPFVLDFGIAREVQETMTRVTGKLSSGTLLYMSPEQLRGRGPKPTQDVYSFAAMAYECLTGQPPFARGQIEWQIVNESPEELPESMGEELRKGVMAGLAKEAGGRPRTCAGVLGGTGQERNSENRFADCESRRADNEKAGWVQALEAERKAREAAEENARQAHWEAVEQALVAQKERKARQEAEARAKDEVEQAQVEGTEPERDSRQDAQDAWWESEAKKGGGGENGVGWLLWIVALLVLAWSGYALWGQGKKSVKPMLPKGGEKPFMMVPKVAPAKAARGAWDGEYESEAREVGLPNGEKMRLHWCPAGRFTMGSPGMEKGRYDNEEQHEVTLTRGFWMAETEVTQGQWKLLMNGETVADLAGKGVQDDTLYSLGGSNQTLRSGGEAMYQNRYGDLDDAVPVYYVSWSEAREFCRRLTQKGHNEGWLPMAYQFRLPTEAEWEYACRAGTKTALPNGKDIQIFGENNAPALDDIAWYGGNSSVGFKEEGLDRAVDTESWPEKQYYGGRAYVRKVRGKDHNRWGLYDMIGNVWEWCEDEYGGYPAGALVDYWKRNDSMALGVHRVMRGGSWLSNARSCRSALRNWSPASYRYRSVGFRPVCSVSE